MTRRHALLHPVAQLAVVVLVVNDHVLKGWADPTLTGKLSDFAGLLFFPALLHASWTLAWPAQDPAADLRRHAIAAVLTGVVFTAVQLDATAGQAWAWALGALQWPVRALWAGALVDVVPAQHTPDPTDLVALPMLALGALLYRKQER